MVDAWTDRYATWRHEVELKVEAGQDVELELEEGARILDDLADERPRRQGQEAGSGGGRRPCVAPAAPPRSAWPPARRTQVAALVAGVPDARFSSSPKHPLWVDRPRAGHAAWYELFPRSYGGLKGRGRAPALRGRPGLRRRLPAADPPDRRHPPQGPGQHPRRRPRRSRQPVGHRRGRGRPRRHPPRPRHAGRLRRLRGARPRTWASRWRSTTPCSAPPTTPGCATTPSGSSSRPDGSIRYAENPPKKYQDIHPIDFWPAEEADRVALWDACRDVLEHWIAHGVRIFRVDNPHTKPLAFWAVGDRRRARRGTPTCSSSPRPSPPRR